MLSYRKLIVLVALFGAGFGTCASLVETQPSPVRTQHCFGICVNSEPPRIALCPMFVYIPPGDDSEEACWFFEGQPCTVIHNDDTESYGIIHLAAWYWASGTVPDYGDYCKDILIDYCSPSASVY